MDSRTYITVEEYAIEKESKATTKPKVAKEESL
jgi:hypothetical protein